jgi:hypothetical protein
MLRVKLSERLKVFVSRNSLLFKERSENKKSDRKLTKKQIKPENSKTSFFTRFLGSENV